MLLPEQVLTPGVFFSVFVLHAHSSISMARDPTYVPLLFFIPTLNVKKNKGPCVLCLCLVFFILFYFFFFFWFWFWTSFVITTCHLSEQALSDYIKSYNTVHFFTIWKVSHSHSAHILQILTSVLVRKAETLHFLLFSL